MPDLGLAHRARLLFHLGGVGCSCKFWQHIRNTHILLLKSTFHVYNILSLSTLAIKTVGASKQSLKHIVLPRAPAFQTTGSAPVLLYIKFNKIPVFRKPQIWQLLWNNKRMHVSCVVDCCKRSEETRLLNHCPGKSTWMKSNNSKRWIKLKYS